MHQKRPFRARKGDGGFSRGSASTRKGDDGFIRGSASTRKGDGGFIRGSASTRKGDGGFRPAHLADRARLRHPWAAAGPGRTTRRRAERSSQRGRRAGGQAPRRPEICRGNKQKQESSRPAAHTASTRDARNTRGTTYNKTARPHRGRAAQPVSVTHRRITTMSGSPRPLSWRTSEIPSLAATSFAVPSMRGSS